MPIIIPTFAFALVVDAFAIIALVEITKELMSGSTHMQ